MNAIGADTWAMVEDKKPCQVSMTSRPDLGVYS